MAEFGRSATAPGRNSGNLGSASDANVHNGSDLFSFWNGDFYKGSFRASVDNHIFRQGEGLYVTGDLHSYGGSWENDTLTGDATVRFPDGSRYTGKVEDLHFHGSGVYVFPHGGRMVANFVRDTPQGIVQLEDCNRNLWHGTAQTTGGVLLNPVNRFLPVNEPDTSPGTETNNVHKDV